MLRTISTLTVLTAIGRTPARNSAFVVAIVLRFRNQSRSAQHAGNAMPTEIAKLTKEAEIAQALCARSIPMSTAAIWKRYD